MFQRLNDRVELINGVTCREASSTGVREKFKGRLHDREKSGTDPTETGTVPIVFAKKR